MSMLEQFMDGSLVSRPRLMQAREFYAPTDKASSIAIAYARWTARSVVQPVPTLARELAGLSGSELEELEAEFVRSPTRRSAPWIRRAVTAGVAMMGCAGLALGLHALASLGEMADRVLQAVGVGCLLTGLIPLGAGLISAFSSLPLDLGHGTVGLMVGKLDEQHPWLYDALGLTKHEAADHYRERTLRDRGPLRGADHIMMRELVRSNEALERVRTARSAADQLQALPIVHEPRLVRAVVRDDGLKPGPDILRPGAK